MALPYTSYRVSCGFFNAHNNNYSSITAAATAAAALFNQLARRISLSRSFNEMKGKTLGIKLRRHVTSHELKLIKLVESSSTCLVCVLTLGNTAAGYLRDNRVEKLIQEK